MNIHLKRNARKSHISQLLSSQNKLWFNLVTTNIKKGDNIKTKLESNILFHLKNQPMQFSKFNSPKNTHRLHRLIHKQIFVNLKSTTNRMSLMSFHPWRLKRTKVSRWRSRYSRNLTTFNSKNSKKLSPISKSNIS